MAVGRYRRGEIDDATLARLEAEACPGEGSCQGLYTANTMACLTETMGMSLPGCATALAGMSKKRHLGYATGQRIVELVRKGITARKIMTRTAFENAIRVDLALGGSSNSVLHLLAIAREAARARQSRKRRQCSDAVDSRRLRLLPESAAPPVCWRIVRRE